LVPWRSITNFQYDGVFVTLVRQMMSDTRGREASAHSRAKHENAAVGVKSRISFYNEDEFVLFRVPMVERGDAPRLQACKVHAEIPDSE
jgi:hypothetical protein